MKLHTRRHPRRGVAGAGTVAALSIALVTSPAASAGTAPEPVPVPATLQVGFSEGSAVLGDHDRELERRMAGIAATGAGWVRIDFRWPDLERRRGSFSWGSVDRIVDAAQDHGLAVLAVLAYTPRWARPRGTTEKAPPKRPRDFGRFASTAARHFRGQVAAYEIWNEPNVPHFWEGGADPVAYAGLLSAAYDAIKDVDGDLMVLTGGTAPASTGDGSMSPVDFLEGIYAAKRGGKDHFDGVAHHAYNWPDLPSTPDAEPNFNSFGLVTPLLRQVMVDHGDAQTQIWLTETGAPVPFTRDGITTTPVYLSDYVQDAFALVTSPQWEPWIAAIFWYSYRDSGTDTAEVEQMFGLVTHCFEPKGSALEAFTAEVARLEPATG
jgi:hypothetical protein